MTAVIDIESAIRKRKFDVSDVHENYDNQDARNTASR